MTELVPLSFSKRTTMQRVRSLSRVMSGTYAHMRRVLAVKNPQSPEGRKTIRDISISWSNSMLRACNMTTRITGVPIFQEPCLFVSNHVGYMDIPVLMSVLPASFVSKKEVRHWLVFGRAADSVGTVFVDRQNMKSRKKVAEEVGHAIQTDKKSVILFPEGTSSPQGKTWKRGAFGIAKSHGFKIQPLRLSYTPHRLASYWGADTFLTHLWKLVGLSHIEAEIEFFEPQFVTDADLDCTAMQDKVLASLHRKIKGLGEFHEDEHTDSK